MVGSWAKEQTFLTFLCCFFGVLPLPFTLKIVWMRFEERKFSNCFRMSEWTTL